MAHETDRDYRTVQRFEMRIERVRVCDPGSPYGTTIRAPEDLESIARQLIGDQAQEVFLAFYLDVRSRLVGYTEVGRGGPSSCQVDLRVLFRNALAVTAEGVIVSHNHPSGDPNPSAEDRALTARILEAAELLGLRLLDHIIVTDGPSFSFAKHNILT